MSELPRPRGARRPSWYTPERARAVCARLAAGETLASICADPGMPAVPTIFRARQQYADFDRAYCEARRTALLREAAARAQRHPPLRPPDQRRPGPPTKRTPEIIAAICARLEAGESLEAIGADPAMPSRNSIHNWLREDPSLAHTYMISRQIQADRIFEEVRDVARAATPGTVGVARLTFDVLRWQAARLWPRRYGYYAAEDLDAAPPEPQTPAEPTPKNQPFTVVIRQFGEVDGKYVEILTPKNAVSYADSRQRALPAPEEDEAGWLAKGGDPDWRNGEGAE